MVLVVAELAVPVVAERRGQTGLAPEHIAERYGLFTLIVLGESVLSATVALRGRVHRGPSTPPSAGRRSASPGCVILFCDVVDLLRAARPTNG